MMDKDKKMNRREALKCMGAAVLGGAVEPSGLLSLAALQGRSASSCFPDGTEKNPNARYRNEHVSLMDLKLANNQKM